MSPRSRSFIAKRLANVTLYHGYRLRSPDGWQIEVHGSAGLIHTLSSLRAARAFVDSLKAI